MDRDEIINELPSGPQGPQGLAGAIEEMIAENLRLAELIAEIALFAEEFSGDFSASSSEIQN